MPRKKRTSTHTNSSKTPHIHIHNEPDSGKKLEDRLIQNVIELQKINVTMIEKFDKLTEQISNLLALFEMTARTFAENPAMQVTEKDKDFLEKIDKLLEQNKTIAKGLVMMEERIREKVYGSRSNEQRTTQPLQQIQQPVPQLPQNNQEKEDMQPSISNTSGRPLPRF